MQRYQAHNTHSPNTSYISLIDYILRFVTNVNSIWLQKETIYMLHL
jgi:hypothetical protein